MTWENILKKVEEGDIIEYMGDKYKVTYFNKKRNTATLERLTSGIHGSKFRLFGSDDLKRYGLI